MRKAQKEQIEEFVKLLGQAHKELKKEIENHNGAAALDLLQQCQEGAIQSGEMIESLEGEGAITISFLENYCEVVYQCYEEIVQNQNVHADKICMKLDEALMQVQNSVKNDIQLQREVVFFPYKASMWDSLESIYLAAKEDEKCKCYVVPIPYFDKNPDGTVGQMHYEGADLPKSVPVVDWKEYDVVNRKPDVAYIHNPYDNQNYVTTVHPGYYAKELKKYVGKLIYCPYFVSGETVGKQYCALPGVLWADKVMVQSEHIRKQYIKYYDEAVSDEKLRAVLGNGEDKFVALGSPKVDKVRFTNKNKEALPEEWELLCRDKKVVFYNTHLSEALANGTIFLTKLRSVLAFFEESKDLALWWRPHPLSEETMAALKPEILQEYQEIVKDYQEQAYGIYDDTPDWHRAVVWADMYYGSVSSLLPLFGITGKPVILQKTNCLSKAAAYEAFVPDGDMMYFISSSIGALVSLNLQTEEWKVEADLPWELQGEISIFSRMFATEDKVYIFVVNANAHFVYDKKEKSFEKVVWHIEHAVPKPNKQIKFAEVLCYNQYFIMMPHRFDAILVYNRESGEVTAHTDWIEVLKKRIKDFSKGEFYFRNRSACIVYNQVFAVLRRDKADVVCQFSVPDMKLEQVYEIPIEGVLQCMESDGESLWMIHNFGKEVVQWDYSKNECITYVNEAMGNSVQGLQYRLIILDNKIYLYPVKKDRKCLVLWDNVLVENSDSCAMYQEKFGVTAHEVCGIHLEDKVLVFMDGEWKAQKKIELKCPNEYTTDRGMQKKLEALQNMQYMKYLTENEVIQFADWLQFLAKKEVNNWNVEILEKKYAEMFHLSGQSAGSLIHEYVMAHLEE